MSSGGFFHEDFAILSEPTESGNPLISRNDSKIQMAARRLSTIMMRYLNCSLWVCVFPAQRGT